VLRLYCWTLAALSHRSLSRSRGRRFAGFNPYHLLRQEINMGTSVQVTPLCGVYNENPLSYLVSIDGFNILIDCGWNDHFDPSLLQPLSRVASTIDAVLLSHPDTLHLGALPYAIKQLGLSAPIYSTEPVYRLGLLTMYDQFLSRKQVSEFDLFTLDDIDSAFQSVTRLTYSQNHHLSGKGEGIVIAPHVAGHLLGGTIWKITKDGEDVIYAVDFNHRKERHLNGTVLGSFVRPAVLITDAYNALNNQPYRRQKDKEFGDILKKTLRAGGNVLLPVDTAGRILELILMLESYWADENLNYPIYFLTYVSSSTIDYVKSFLEWMSDSIAKSFEQTRENIFLLKNITLLVNKADLDNAPDGPKVVLASMASLEAGFSHDIFVEWGNDVKNLVLFTERGQFGTLARMLQADPPPKAVKVTVSKRVPLVGEELIAYEEEQNRIKKEEALKASLMKEEELKASQGADNNTIDPMVIDTGNNQPSPEVAVQKNGGYRDVFIDGFVPPSTSVAPMFPCYENTSEWDDFGEVINPDDYVIKEEDMDQTANNVGGDINGKLDESAASLIFDTKPSKVISDERTVQVRCSLVYMDFEGRSDGRSIKNILSHVAPLKLVLVHGSAEATDHLKQHCLKNVCPHVYAPQIEETIDVTSDLCAYKVQLSEKLMSNVLFKKLGEYEIAWVDAEVGKTENDTLSLLPVSGAPHPHKSVLVGDLKLADFKQFLSTKGVPVEFAGGALRCGEYVTVRKVGDATQKASASFEYL
ncbi:cleavage and polyadenylation specificity factor subunit 2-like protein, partial [Trifolium pratense]